jgi:hypothetical protein
MKRHNVHVTATTPAAPAVVYGLLTDGSTWPAWSTIESVEIEREGTPAPEGVGAIRVNKRGRTTGRDEILELVPDRRFKYAGLSGLPTRDYVGEVELAPTPDGGTSIHWRSSFFAKAPVPGWVMARGIHKFLSECVTGLAAYASSVSDAPNANRS